MILMKTQLSTLTLTLDFDLGFVNNYDLKIFVSNNDDMNSSNNNIWRHHWCEQKPLIMDTNPSQILNNTTTEQLKCTEYTATELDSRKRKISC